MNRSPDIAPLRAVISRGKAWFGLIVLIFSLFLIRSFYLQVIRYNYYKNAALSDQLKEYEVQASRGTISAHEGGGLVPLVLNQKLFTLYADPTLVKHPAKVADKLAGILGDSTNSGDLQKLVSSQHTRYVILAKKLTPDQSDKILKFEFPGIGTQEHDYRTYPQGSMAAQLLGFVNDEGSGEYGVEQALDSKLAGHNGLLKAVTDVRGVPLAASSDNLSTAPVSGNDITLTLNVGMQAQTEKIIKAAHDKLHAKGVSAVILDTNSGAVKAMANYPSYDPANYQDVDDPNLFKNGTVTDAVEVGSIMKVLTTAAALDQGVVQKDTSFYDPGSFTVDGFKITDVAIDHSTGQQNLASLLNLSLNTGATWLLMQMGGGQINQKARDVWHDYMVNHFLLGQATGIAQGYESAGYIPSPKDNGAGINLTYANTSFGQAMTATPLQMAAAVSSAINGGTYYKPYLIDKTATSDGKVTTTKPKVMKTDTVSPQVSNDMVGFMNYFVTEHLAEGFGYMRFSPDYSVGGKTGSAQIAKPTGGYYDNEFYGTFVGFVGGDKPEYTIVVYVNQPQIPYGYVGAQAAQPVFADLAHMLIDDFGVTPRR
ncbi:MAG: penicillin-binding protein 2 [Candidatus Saccharimonadales bacterium]